jgi:hypothetical protein
LGLLGRAKSMMQAWSAPPAAREQAYSVACPEGHRLHGMRTEGYQALRCPTCGEGIFVLPRSPLPEPSAPASPPRNRVAAVVEEAYPDDDPLPLSDPSPMTTSTVDLEVDGEPEVEIDWVDDGPVESVDEVKPPEPAPGPSKEVRPRPKANPRPGPVNKPPPPKRRRALVPAVEAVDRPSLSEWAWGHRNALLAVGVVLLVIGAVAFRFRRQRLEDLPRIAEIGRTEGLRKLDAGDFAAAKQLLADAASAVDGLGGRYEGAESIRQGAREAAIFTDLVPATLDQLLEEAATFRDDAKEWPSRFAGMYRGRSIILDAPISAVPDPGKPDSSYQIVGRIYFGPGPMPVGKGRIDLSGFQLFELSQPKVGDQQTFGARLAGLELDLGSNEWVLTLEPDSGVYITHPRALEAIGWPSFEPLEEPRP